MRRTHRIRAIALTLALLTSAGGASHGSPILGDKPYPAPRFSLRDLTGGPLDLARLLRHGPVLLDFWATWCAPCDAELPELEALSRTYGPAGLTVIGVSVDGPRNFARVRPFTTSRKLTFPIALDTDGKLQQVYRVITIPTTFLIDTTGTVVRVQTGYRPGETAGLEAAIRALGPPPAP